MIEAFDNSQEIVRSQRFNLVYDRISYELQDKGETNTDQKRRQSGAARLKAQSLSRISYFVDFIIMQQMMTIEMDIGLGQLKNSIKYLNVDINEDAEQEEDEDDEFDIDALIKKKKKSFDRKQLDLKMEETEGEVTNKYKLDVMEQKMNTFFSIF